MLRTTTRVAWRVAELRAGARRGHGQGMVEYGLILALIAVSLLIVIGFVTGGLKTAFNTVSSSLNSA